jgi:hypothetical protein
MISELRRRLVRSDGIERWDANQRLDRDLERVTELPEDRAVLPITTSLTFRPSIDNITMTDYCTGLVKAAITQGGAHDQYQMPVPWLRMILAGLEGKPIEPQKMWEGVEASSFSGGPNPSLPPYDEVFRI